MRSLMAVLGGIVFLVIGVFSISTIANSTKDVAIQNGTNESAEAYNATTGVLEGLTQTAGPAIVWMGVAAVVLVALGFLVYAGQSGR